MSLGDHVMETAAALRDCLVTELALRPNPPAETCILPGIDGVSQLSIGTMENRCCAGFAWVRVVTVVPEIPVDRRAAPNCGVQTWQLDLEIGVARCAVWGTIAAGPTCDQMLAMTVQQQSDAEAMRAALCCLAPQVDSGNVFPTAWIPFGPEGGCTGGIMGVSVTLDDCVGCDN